MLTNVLFSVNRKSILIVHAYVWCNLCVHNLRMVKILRLSIILLQNHIALMRRKVSTKHTQHHISEDTAKAIACSMIHGRLDYCNSVPYGTSAANLNKIQRVQNSAARIITRTRRSDHATPKLADPHWLPVKYRIQYKAAVIVYKVLTA